MEWIKVSDRLPKYKESVLLVFPQYKGTPICEGMLDSTNENGHRWITSEGCDRKDATHWMPLPEPPEGHNK